MGPRRKKLSQFLDLYNYQRYHETLGNVTPYDVYTGQHLEMLQRRKEVKSRTLKTRKAYNRTVRERSTDL